jgi:hypothetical protein
MAFYVCGGRTKGCGVIFEVAEAQVAVVAQKTTNDLCCVAMVYVERANPFRLFGAADGAGVVLRRPHVIKLFLGDAILTFALRGSRLLWIQSGVQALALV